MIKFKSSICSLFFLLFALIIYPVYAKDLSQTLLFMNDSPVTLKHNPMMKGEKMYVHLRDLCALLSLPIDYDAISKEAIITGPEGTFTYNLATMKSFFNDMEVLNDSPPFVLDQATWVPVIPFVQFFSFSADPNEELLIETYMGKEKLILDYLSEPLYIDVYDYTSVSSTFINQSIAADAYLNGKFSTRISGATMTNSQVTLTFNPFTEVHYPEDYTLIGDDRLLNFSNNTLTLPVSPSMVYTYLTYEPDTFSTATTTDLADLWQSVKDDQLYLADLTIVDGVIIAIKQLYVP